MYNLYFLQSDGLIQQSEGMYGIRFCGQKSNEGMGDNKIGKPKRIQKGFWALQRINGFCFTKK